MSFLRFVVSIVTGNKGLAGLRLANTATILLDSLHYQIVTLKDYMKNHLQTVPLLGILSQVVIKIIEMFLLIPKFMLKFIRKLAGGHAPVHTA